MKILLGWDAVTLREKVDLRAAGERLAELGDMRNLQALSERAWLLKALDVASQAVRLARFTGNRRDLLLPRILRTQVLQYLGRYDEAIYELTLCADDARTQNWPTLESVALQHRGRVLFDAGEYAAALADFKAAVLLRNQAGASEAELEPSLIAIAVTESFLSESA
jgi:tetratricopeptide (TPR) repeat protein